MSTAQKRNTLNRIGSTVFVVDDDAAMRGALEFLIRSAGLRVRSFESASAFLNYYDASMGGCLLLDVRMPGMSGLQVLTTLRRDETLRDIPTVLQSTLPDAAPRSPHFPTEQKPCTYHGLIEQLERLAR